MTYHGSKRHHENAVNALRLATKRHEELKAERIKVYYLNPKPCLSCGDAIPYEKKNQGKFCNRSCAASYNNRGREVTEEHRLKTANAVRKKADERGRSTRPKTKSRSIPITLTCKCCGSSFEHYGYSRKKTCSRVCHTQLCVKNRTYQNGSRKPSWFYNPFQQQNVLLESSWEISIAQILTDRNIEWTRPNPVQWNDAEGKPHLYYPDFYLVKNDVYLDPKNPYCMDLDREKIAIVSE